MPLEKYIMTCLDEIRTQNELENSEFLQGELYAYLECLEIILQGQGVDNAELLALEERLGVR